jgi:Protein of unknown function (DUF3108)
MYRSKDGSKMMCHLRAIQTTFLATGAALAFMTVAFGDYAHAEGNFDASYTISFAHVRVGDITATVVVGDSEYTIFARGRVGGVIKVLQGLSQEACRHTLPVFDGHQRYDLKLAFKRMEKVTAEQGYAGPVVVCSVGYEPIAGHRASTPLVKYLSEGREMEMALAPVAGTRLLAPVRVSVLSMLANIVIEASRFEATAHPVGASTVADPKAQ